MIEIPTEKKRKELLPRARKDSVLKQRDVTQNDSARKGEIDDQKGGEGTDGPALLGMRRCEAYEVGCRKRQELSTRQIITI